MDWNAVRECVERARRRNALIPDVLAVATYLVLCEDDSFAQMLVRSVDGPMQDAMIAEYARQVVLTQRQLKARRWNAGSNQQAYMQQQWNGTQAAAGAQHYATQPLFQVPSGTQASAVFNGNNSINPLFQSVMTQQIGAQIPQFNQAPPLTSPKHAISRPARTAATLLQPSLSSSAGGATLASPRIDDQNEAENDIDNEDDDSEVKDDDDGDYDEVSVSRSRRARPRKVATTNNQQGVFWPSNQRLIGTEKRRTNTSTVVEDDSNSTAAAATSPRIPLHEPKRWSPLEDEQLRTAVTRFAEKNWSEIAECVPGRRAGQCLQRWKNVLDPSIARGQWTDKEDALLLKIVNGPSAPQNWGHASKFVPGRTAKQCRERFVEYLNPKLNRSPFSVEEDELLLKKHDEMGNRWADISKLFNGRADGALKMRCKQLESLQAGPRKRSRRSDDASSSTSGEKMGE